MLLDGANAVNLIRMFNASPLAALALCICLASILWCIVLTHRYRTGVDKVLAGLIGLIAISEAMRVLRDSGVAGFTQLKNGWADFMVATLYLIAVMILKISSMDRVRTRAQLRLVEANEKPVEISRPASAVPPDLSNLLFDASPLATFATDGHSNVIYWNPAAERLLGWTREEVLGRRLPLLFPGRLINKHGVEVQAEVWTAPISAAGDLGPLLLTIIVSEADHQPPAHGATVGFDKPAETASTFDPEVCASITLGWNPRM